MNDRVITFRLRVPGRAAVRGLRQVLLTVGGLGMLTSAAYVAAGLAAGLAAAGVSMLVLEWLTSPGQPKGGNGANPAR